MSDDEKWYSYPEDEQPDQQNPELRQRKMFILGVVIGMGVMAMLGLVAYLFFRGGENVALPSLAGFPFRFGIAEIIFVVLILVFVLKVTAMRSGRVQPARQYPRQFDGNSSTLRLAFILVVGLFVLVMGILMFFMQL